MDTAAVLNDDDDDVNVKQGTKRVNKMRKTQRYQVNKNQVEIKSGFTITPKNMDLAAFMQGFWAEIKRQDYKGLDFHEDMINPQKEFFFNNFQAFFQDLKGLIPYELSLVSDVLDCKEPLLINSKITMNYDIDKKEWLTCHEQIPHMDTTREDLVFMVIPISKQVSTTNVFGSKDDFLKIDNEAGLIQFFQPNSKVIENGQVFLFKPNIIHSGPKIDGTERVLLYLEFSSNEITHMKYQVITIYEMRKEFQLFKTWFENVKKEREWNYAMKVKILLKPPGKAKAIVHQVEI